MNQESLNAAALALAQARATRNTCGRISEGFDIHSLQDAYAVQELNTLAALAAGRRLSGRKIGLTSLAVQQQLGVDQPDFGMLFADMECRDGDAIDSQRLIQPKARARSPLFWDVICPMPIPRSVSFCARSITFCRLWKLSTRLSRTGKSPWSTRWPITPPRVCMYWARPR